MANLKSQTDGNILLVYFTEARILDEATIQKIDDELNALMERTEQEHILLDFRCVRFMSSAMLGKLIRFHKKCKEFKVKLKMCSIAPEILEVFKMTRLNKVFEIYDDEEKARASCGKRGFFF